MTEARSFAARIGSVPPADAAAPQPAHPARRRWLIAGTVLGAISLPTRAHHGWSGFDPQRPLYLEGQVLRVRWNNPHAELDIELPAGLKRPAGLERRPLPAQTAAIDGPALLSKAAVPSRPDRRWTIELAPLTRMQAWGVAEVQVGQTVAVVGFARRDTSGEPLVRAEYLFVGERSFGLRSSPAAG